jgi:hypothetical protein
MFLNVYSFIVWLKIKADYFNGKRVDEAIFLNNLFAIKSWKQVTLKGCNVCLMTQKALPTSNPHCGDCPLCENNLHQNVLYLKQKC